MVKRHPLTVEALRAVRRNVVADDWRLLRNSLFASSSIVRWHRFRL